MRNSVVRRARGTAAAVAAMAALTASQPPGTAPARASAPVRQGPVAPEGPSVSGDAPYRTQLPPLAGAEGRAKAAPPATLPASVFAAYRRAEARLARTDPGCRLRWQLLAAIGQVESGQAGGGRVRPDGTTLTPIRGPRLDGRGFALIRDTDGGAHDGDTAYDRAVGPMQFIPSTWASWGADGNGDGRADPHNVYDAALAAGRYLCAGGRNLSDPADLERAILGYNHSRAYLRTVLAWYAYFLGGHRVVPDAAGSRTAPRAGASPAPSPAPAPRPSDRAEPRPAPEPEPTPAPPTRKPAPPQPQERPSVPLPAPSRPLAPAEPGDLLPSPPDLLEEETVPLPTR
ncbi:lytic transglycosylase domain-containing protein [Streptomyces sp. enrichment culture]|uniref:lytic transglycosylase domain-containing protein n=1 Tax=Streptomyces sp. enrichment culture TaxID=1795815 RepID=UPI003F5439BE